MLGVGHGVILPRGARGGEPGSRASGLAGGDLVQRRGPPAALPERDAAEQAGDVRHDRCGSGRGRPGRAAWRCRRRCRDGRAAPSPRRRPARSARACATPSCRPSCAGGRRTPTSMDSPSPNRPCDSSMCGSSAPSKNTAQPTPVPRVITSSMPRAGDDRAALHVGVVGDADRLAETLAQRVLELQAVPLRDELRVGPLAGGRGGRTRAPPGPGRAGWRRGNRPTPGRTPAGSPPACPARRAAPSGCTGRASRRAPARRASRRRGRAPPPSDRCPRRRSRACADRCRP